MKIVSGVYRSRKIDTLNGNATRPTLARVKENMLNLVRNELDFQTNVLDLFAGSGSIGLEFISNNVGRVDFVENNRAAVEVIEKNIFNLKIDANKFNLIKSDYSVFLKEVETEYDIIFIDPPFNSDYCLILNNVVESKACGRDTLLIVESDKNRNIDFSKFNIVKSKNYGIINISLIKVRGER